jgi:hypothetical protein
MCCYKNVCADESVCKTNQTVLRFSFPCAGNSRRGTKPYAYRSRDAKIFSDRDHPPNFTQVISPAFGKMFARRPEKRRLKTFSLIPGTLVLGSFGVLDGTDDVISLILCIRLDHQR